ncbi:ABC-type putative multidrug transporter, ATPase subunit [Corynebacterium glutamicum MB001]|uniref:ABC-type transporter, ATPase component n=2 Tax=Corynebacterium TaxID=1716 RepID=Q8NP07_CORGL|nr:MULTISPECIES: ABC transporter ATP-binding protein [Corynebacterium]AGT05758.1 ABC-type putative multidrug transporter, ATPase subunit [Corynebacterium glutamicum MB001]AJE67710.1 ABC transporter ATP-binding protein [Corynebacterium glutamicum]AKF27756.1 ABC transporter ATP-binding protein [[Brevibacterium] flavum]ALP50476.1 ABC transporter ATP-binding protein [Corynebacterium glutamicum]AMA00493.1 ABC transporter ATP-binding protein [Corynebacterium glutamicum]
MTDPENSQGTPQICPTDPTTQALAVRGLTKSYGDATVVNNINLDIPKGAIYGIVGPNGAGKTTMLSMATGLLRPNKGTAWISGFNVWEEPNDAKRSMGLLADGLPIFDRLTGKELLTYVGALRELDEGIVDQRSEELLEALGLKEAAGKRVVDYSAGMTKKILLAQALIHNPKVLILDEPLEAVDPVSGRLIQQILKNFAQTGGTVVLSSHVMELVEGLCDHVAIINRGVVEIAGHVDEVRRGRSLTDVFVDAVGGAALQEGSLSWLGASEGHSEGQNQNEDRAE